MKTKSWAPTREHSSACRMIERFDGKERLTIQDVRSLTTHVSAAAGVPSLAEALHNISRDVPASDKLPIRVRQRYLSRRRAPAASVLGSCEKGICLGVRTESKWASLTSIRILWEGFTHWISQFSDSLIGYLMRWFKGVRMFDGLPWSILATAMTGLSVLCEALHGYFPVSNPMPLT